MPRKPTLSPSKITTYLACPVKFRWAYVDPRGKWYMRSKSYYSFGSSLHRVLQRFHDSADIGVRTVEEALTAVEGSWIAAGYSTVSETEEALNTGREIVRAHVERSLSEPITAETVYVERMMRLDMGEFALLGRLDRLDRHSDGTLEIIDYKSGRTAISSQDVANDIAMGCYQLLVRSKFPDVPVVASILALRSGAKGSYSFSDEEAEQFTSDIIALGLEILHTDYESLIPVWKEICPECDFLKLCLRHPEFDAPRIA